MNSNFIPECYETVAVTAPSVKPIIMNDTLHYTADDEQCQILDKLFHVVKHCLLHNFKIYFALKC